MTVMSSLWHLMSYPSLANTIIGGTKLLILPQMNAGASEMAVLGNYFLTSERVSQCNEVAGITAEGHGQR